MFYDFHIHSALSPCADDDMTVNNILNMAIIKKLDIIAICDHNSTKQQFAVNKAIKNKKIKVLYGIEVESREEVHILGLFTSLKDNLNFGDFVESKRFKIKNNPEIFGNQLILDEEDNVIGKEDYLLITSINCSVEEVCKAIKDNRGIVVLAHAMSKKNGIITQLGYIPENLLFDAIEIISESHKKQIIEQNKHLKDSIWLINSDAHRLVDISEAINFLKPLEINKLGIDKL